MNIIDVDAIIDYLREKVAESSNEILEDLRNWKIFSELPIQENSNLVLVVSSFPPVVESEVSKILTIRCSLFGGKAEYPDTKLVKILEYLTEILTNNYSWNVPDFGFWVYKIAEAGWSPWMIDEKWRNIRVKDFYLYYTV